MYLRAHVGAHEISIAGCAGVQATLVVGLVKPAVDERRLRVAAETQERHLSLPLLLPFEHTVRHIVSLNLVIAIVIA